MLILLLRRASHSGHRSRIARAKLPRTALPAVLLCVPGKPSVPRVGVANRRRQSSVAQQRANLTTTGKPCTSTLLCAYSGAWCPSSGPRRRAASRPRRAARPSTARPARARRPPRGATSGGRTARTAAGAASSSRPSTSTVRAHCRHSKSQRCAVPKHVRCTFFARSVSYAWSVERACSCTSQRNLGEFRVRMVRYCTGAGLRRVRRPLRG